ncbi:formyl transferase [Glaciecola sp. XM2]|uniref:formyl transferase n=1 Tax=Glaciecola sp. XM2 TaxID=1914931 RepID=UPI001BDE22B1|nr:formyl transferase [Glaciecola sp. XM2]MBT1450439.1 formyl transferase [Glaciecola sp. XM2]
MKILCLANRDLASNFALNQLLPELSKSHETHLWLSAKVGGNTQRPKQLQNLKFFEQDLFNTLVHRALSSTQGFLGFDGLGQFLCSEVKEVNQINSPQAVAELKVLSPDIIVSIRYGAILKNDAINIPSKCVLNLHSGILPKYKGVMATFWALKNADSEIGTTLHLIEDGSIDTGKIIKVSTIQTNASKSYLWHVLALYEQGVKTILEAVNTLNQGDVLECSEQSPSDTYFTLPTQQQCEEFEACGGRFVDEQEYIEFIQTHYLPVDAPRSTT